MTAWILWHGVTELLMLWGVEVGRLVNKLQVNEYTRVRVENTIMSYKQFMNLQFKQLLPIAVEDYNLFVD